ncbi:MAG TPA: DUF6653 family protein [Gemmatimonadales bacterium]|nr:DUF6653 family protein [Gemmatimonadales bacterium]
MGSLAEITRRFGMSDEVWRRHANPWSVWTRFAAIPAMILAIWSRVVLGWWALVPVVLVGVWLWLNPRVFAPVEPVSWAAKGIYGERMWVHEGDRIPMRERALLRWLALSGSIGFGLLAWGLYTLRVWPTVAGSAIIVIGQLWRIDRLGRIYDATR